MSGRARLRACLAVMLAALAAACGTSEPVAPPRFPPSGPALSGPALSVAPAGFAALPGWGVEEAGAALAAFRRSCARLATLPDGRAMAPSGLGGTAGDWKPACAEAANAADARAFFETRFWPVALSGPAGPEGLFTGYFEPELHGARSRGGPYLHPLYRPPPGGTSADRAAIDGGALAGRGLELLWLDDPVDLFFLHIQGSGLVRLAEGGAVRVGFAGHNGKEYFAIGRELLRRGAVPAEAMSLQAIRAWLQAHPGEAAPLMQMNPRYIFFQEVKGDGPVGAQGVVLSPGRSLAVDKDLLPLGAPVWIATTHPLDGRPLHRLVVAQDTGAAIKGAVRGDLFWGAGAEAEALAGPMKQPGRAWLLLPRHLVTG